MESFFGSSPWDFGTGFSSPFGTDSQSFQPVMPQVDLAGQMAQGLASQGIRPDQFFANPQGSMEALQPPGGTGDASSNPWDPTPVSTPSAPSLGQSSAAGAGTGGNPNIQTDDAAGASATGTPADAAAGKQKSFGDKLQETLKGVKMPQAPTPQKVSTPAAPRPTTAIKAGDLLNMMLALTPPSAQMRQIPSLGGSLKGVIG